MTLRCILCFILITFISACGPSFSQRELDGFESDKPWTTIISDSTVHIQTSTVDGKSGRALRIDYEFSAGTGFCGIEKEIPLDLPENFQFSFYLKGESPSNNLEFKLLDKSGENVWWRNQRSFDFPQKWTRIRVKKRDIEFAWGPIQDKALHSVNKIQFFIASSAGGKGTVYLDDFRFATLAAPDTVPPEPSASVSSRQKDASGANLFDGHIETAWRNQPGDSLPEIVIDLHKNYEYGGLVIDWDEQDYAREYDVFSSNDKNKWEIIYRLRNGNGGRAYLPLRNGGSRYLKLALKKSARHARFAINEISVKDFAFSETPEALYSRIARDNPRGFFPRYFYGEQTYWTICGVNNDRDEALINEDGMVEVDKKRFSVEPFIFSDGRLFSWNDTKNTQHLMDDYLPIPSVTREKGGLKLTTQIFSDGPAGASVLYFQYTLKNILSETQSGNMYLAIRPFQVNPPWQFLNTPGGTVRIKNIAYQSNRVQVDDDKTVFSLSQADAFGAASFDEGDITRFLHKNTLPSSQQVSDDAGLASGALKYHFRLEANGTKTVILAVPFHTSSKYVVSEKQVPSRLEAVRKFWQKKLNTVHFRLPSSAKPLINTLRSNLAYILINRDGFGIQPGSRSYERSWIRDGALTSSALLKMGVRREVKAFINWYSAYQYANGKVPCVVDSRGPDPTPENDSHGQLIFALLQYYNFTGDKAFLEKNYIHVQKAIAYMDGLRASRKTARYVSGSPTEKACYGLLPESISHEGYSAKPMHSYWDDFFALKGYKDAVRIAGILGHTKDAERFAAARDSFKTDVYHSIKRAMENKQIDYIPGCVELGDFDATSTAIAIYPVNELQNLPQPQARNTFERYFKYFQQRRDAQIDWRDYTPYEVRLIGTFIRLGQRERAHRLVDFFFKDRRPAAWNHWAEVVRKGYRTPGFIGDMPHTWVGSDFISALRSFFVYEDEQRQSLVIGAGLYREWLDAPQGIGVRNLPTYYGKLSYDIKKQGSTYRVKLYGMVKLPPGKLELVNFRKEKPVTVQVNGKQVTEFDENKILVKEFPAHVRIEY